MPNIRRFYSYQHRTMWRQRDTAMSFLWLYLKIASLNSGFLQLSETVQYSKYIRPICITPKDFPIDSTTNQNFQGESFTMAGQTCAVLGWGETGTNHFFCI